jgi:transcriptional regulator with XRE-family HTH domain
VHEVRLRAGLTLKELSARMTDAGAPVDARTIGAWERGPQEPRPSTVIGVLEQVLDLPPDTLLVRLSGRTRDPEAFDLRRLLRPERLYYVTTAIRQHVQVDAAGRVASIETTQSIRALFSGVTMCVFAHAADGTERMQVRPVAGCDTRHWWPPTRGLQQVRIGLPGPALQAGEERTFTYRVDHTYQGPDRQPTPEERRHQAHGTPTLRKLEMRVSFPGPRFTVRRCIWLSRGTAPLTGSGSTLLGRDGPLWTWANPTEETYGASWDLPL